MRILTISFLVITSIVHCIHGSIDFSNVDLRNFRYFKYPVGNPKASYLPPATRYRNAMNMRQMVPPTPRPEAGPLVKARAVLGYVSSVLFGNLPGEAEVPVFFHPDSAYKMRERYQRQFGYRGDRLVAGLGRGQSPATQRARFNGI